MYLQTFVTQMVGTFVFVILILHVKGRSNPSTDGAMGALTIGITLGTLVPVGSKTGACFNPGVCLALTIL